MKKFCMILSFLLIPVFSFASPFLVCDPQAGITTYKLTGPAWVPVAVPAQPDGSIRMDVAPSLVGQTSLTVAACITDPVWGESCSTTVPFVFTRPGTPNAATNIKLNP
jgi:hypothetical protein